MSTLKWILLHLWPYCYRKSPYSLLLGYSPFIILRYGQGSNKPILLLGMIFQSPTLSFSDYHVIPFLSVSLLITLLSPPHVHMGCLFIPKTTINTTL
jgi:hypothetical protein